jgi:hypothetical protein
MSNRNNGGSYDRPRRLPHKPVRSKQGIPLRPQPGTVPKPRFRETVQDMYRKGKLK